MQARVRPLALAALLTAAACQQTGTVDPTTQTIVGSVAGAAIGAITAEALNADDEWVILAGLAGAAAGALVARNPTRQQCAYSNGDGTYSVAPCPR